MKTGPTNHAPHERRQFLSAVASAAGLALTGCATTRQARGARAAANAKHEDAEVTPGEDLRQEHGVLERILLVYDEGARRIGTVAEVLRLETALGIGDLARFTAP